MGLAVLVEIARTGFTAVHMHPLRSFVTVSALVAVLLPYLACLGLSQGIQEEAEASVRLGADLYVTAQQFGRNVPIPLSAIDDIRRIPGVVEVVPRIVGGIVLPNNRQTPVAVPLHPDRFPSPS